MKAKIVDISSTLSVDTIAKINTTYEWTKNSNYVKPKSPPQLLKRRFWFNVCSLNSQSIHRWYLF